LIAEFSQRAGLIVGAGTVLTVDEARAAAQAGASFLVSPVVDELVLEEAHRLGLPVMPGCATPTEMLRAYRAGAQLQKLFPAPGTGPAWVKQTLGPMPFLKIVPTSGVTLENAAAFWQAGAYALGFVASLFPDADLTAHRFDLIQARAQEMLAAVGRA
jgi:2-dehydro-3-deoxyphosphogluconate aldolase/(4S)-4-hydroxy-2-oxoglutarate aldolase